jgi:lysophospholipase L1-like esterase
MRVRRFVVIIAAVASLAIAQAQNGAPKPRRIAVFGSSVANGTGDELAMEGYTGRLRELLVARGWEVLNQSRGGDNTIRMAPRFAPEGAPQPNVRYLLPVNPTYVLLGLSLGNEGIRNAATRAEKDAIFDQFAKGLRGFVDRSRQNGIVPIVTSCYTRMDFTDVEYEYTRRMNLLLDSWDVPTVNFLGAIDDGTGKWARGFWFDSLHPNAAGHVEITQTFVPTLFEALERGKPMPERVISDNFVRLTAGDLRISFCRPILSTRSRPASACELSRTGHWPRSAAAGSTLRSSRRRSIAAGELSSSNRRRCRRAARLSPASLSTLDGGPIAALAVTSSVPMSEPTGAGTRFC